jgi:hypothetical protein
VKGDTISARKGEGLLFPEVTECVPVMAMKRRHTCVGKKLNAPMHKLRALG